MTVYTPPTVLVAYPGGNRFTDRIKLPRGLCVITDGAGGWAQKLVPFAGELEDLVEGVDYFLGGHEYDIADEVIATLPPPDDGGGSGGGGGGPTPPPPGDTVYGYGVDPYGEGGYGT